MNYKNIEQGDLLQENDEIFGYGKLSIPSDKKWAKIPNWLVGKILPFGISVLRRPIKEAPSPTEPVEFRQHYIFLKRGDTIQEKDEFYAQDGMWLKVRPACIGLTTQISEEYRRKVPTYSPAMA